MAVAEFLCKKNFSGEAKQTNKQTLFFFKRGIVSLQSFKYLGSVVTDEGSKPEILSRIAQTTAAFTRLKPI